MSKVLPATCENGVVSVSGGVVPAAEILSEGVAASEGVAVLDADKAFYLAKTSPDLKSTLEKIASALEKTVTALNKTATVLTALDAKPVGGTGSAPAIGSTTDIADISAAATELSTLKTDIETLKDALK